MSSSPISQGRDHFSPEVPCSTPTCIDWRPSVLLSGCFQRDHRRRLPGSFHRCRSGDILPFSGPTWLRRAPKWTPSWRSTCSEIFAICRACERRRRASHLLKIVRRLCVLGSTAASPDLLARPLPSVFAQANTCQSARVGQCTAAGHNLESQLSELISNFRSQAARTSASTW